MKTIFVALAIFLSTSLVFAAFDFDNGVSDNSETNFNTGGGAPQCYLTGEGDAIWKFADGSTIPVMVGGETPETVNSKNGCYQEDGLPGPVCCLQTYTCNQVNGACEKSDPVVTSCSNYQTEDECRAYNLQDVEYSIYEVFFSNLESEEVSGIPDQSEIHFCQDPQVFVLEGIERLFANCGCVWDESLENPGTFRCQEYYKDISDLDVPPGIDLEIYQCVTDLSPLQDMCEEQDIYLVSWTAERFQVDLNGEVVTDSSGNPVEAPSAPDCRDGSAEFDCPISITIGFFNWINFFIASLLLIGVYFVWKGLDSFK